MAHHRQWVLLVVWVALIAAGLGLVALGLPHDSHGVTRRDRPAERSAVYYHDHRLTPRYRA